MKRIVIATIIFTLLLSTAPALASAPAGFSGGVHNEYQYEELVFITGEPIKFVGEIEISEKDKGNVKTIEYDYNLVPEDRTLEGELDRKIKLEITYEDRNDKGQVIANVKLTKYKENIEIGEDEYELEDFQLSKSDVIDKRPASDFYSGNIKGRKYFTINEDEGTVIMDMTGGSVGYNNFWGNTETQIIDYVITSDRLSGEEKIHWQATVRVNVSDSTTKILRYIDNQANLSSFNGGYIRTTNREIVSKYEYTLPAIWNGEPDPWKQYSGQQSLSQNMVPVVERLIVPKFKDVDGHWAENYVEKLYSLDIFEEVSQFFSPNIPITRAQYTKAIMKACDIRPVIEETRKRSITTRDRQEEESPFIDVSVDHPEYQYIKEAQKKELIKGVTPLTFEPESSPTRAQAITVMVRALGFGSKAPNPGYYTDFTDDGEIPYWAKDSIYVAREVGLVQGDNNNKIWPNKKMTRAEASAMIVRFLEFLEKDLQKDYRENIILFN